MIRAECNHQCSHVLAGDLQRGERIRAVERALARVEVLSAHVILLPKSAVLARRPLHVLADNYKA